MEFGPRPPHARPPATGPASLPWGAAGCRPGPLSPPGRVPPRGGTTTGLPPGTPHPSAPPPAACRVSASCCALSSPYRRWRTPARDHTGAHEPLPTGGTPLRTGVPPLRTHRLPVQRGWRLQRRLAKRHTTDGQGRRVAGRGTTITPHGPRLVPR